MTPLPGSHLKLFSGSDDDSAPPPPLDRSLFPADPDRPKLSADSTLPQLYELHFRPIFHAFASEATVKETRQNLKRWKALTADPPLRSIDDAVCAKFCSDLLASGLSFATIDKYKRQLQPILNAAGPKTHRKGERRNAALIEMPPWFPDIPVPQELVKKPRPTEAQLRAIWNACVLMNVPRVHGIEPAAWWRTFIATCFELGVRRREAIKLQFGWLDRQPHATYRVIRGDARKKKVRGLVKRLSPKLAAAYEAMRTTDRALIFDFPYRGIETLNRQYDRLLTKAGVPTGQNLAFHSLRRKHTDYLGAETAKVSLG